MSCDHKGRKCINSRDRGEFRYRRYSCDKCKTRYSTIELTIDDVDLLGKNVMNVITAQLMKKAAERLNDCGTSKL